MTSKGMKNYDYFNFNQINMSNISDGTYQGTEDGGIVKATVEVTIQNHIITDLKLISHQNGKGKPAESILATILDQNNLNVDTVSGATYSSNVIKAAIYNALQRADE